MEDIPNQKKSDKVGSCDMINDKLEYKSLTKFY